MPPQPDACGSACSRVTHSIVWLSIMWFTLLSYLHCCVMYNPQVDIHSVASLAAAAVCALHCMTHVKRRWVSLKHPHHCETPLFGVAHVGGLLACCKMQICIAFRICKAG